MSRKCDISGKRPLSGYNVSHANNKTKRKQIPNLKVKRITVQLLGQKKQIVKLKLSTKIIKTIDKIGLRAVLKKNNLRLKDLVLFKKQSYFLPTTTTFTIQRFLFTESSQTDKQLWFVLVRYGSLRFFKKTWFKKQSYFLPTTTTFTIQRFLFTESSQAGRQTTLVHTCLLWFPQVF